MKYGFITNFLIEDSIIKKNTLLEFVSEENIFEDDKGFQALQKIIKKDDILVLYKTHDLASDWPVFIKRWNELHNLEVRLEVILDQSFSTVDNENKDANDLLSILEIGYDMNIFYLNQKKIEGMKKARQNGVRFGRKKVDNPKDFEKYYHLWKAKKLPIKDAAAAIGMNTSTFFRHCRDFTKELESSM